jgi:hypothetical protein
MGELKIINDKELKKESRSLAIQDNIGLIPMAVGFSGAGMTFALDLLMYSYASLAVAGLGVLILGSNLIFRKNHFQQNYLKAHNKEIEKQNIKKLENIKKSLKNEKAARQMELFKVKYVHFKNVLKEQLSESSLAFQRLIGGFDQLYLMATNNVEKVLNYEQNMSKIDRLYIKTELDRLSKIEVLKEYEETEIRSLQERLQLWSEYQEKINVVLADNEVALTKMDSTLASLTELKKPENMRSALAELQTLANVLDKRTKPKGIDLTE